MRREAGTAEDSAAGLTRVPWWVVEVCALSNYRLFVRFADGTAGEVDVSAMILGPRAGVFEPLRDESKFRAVYVELGAVSWPGDLDLAPDAMYDEIRAHGGYKIRPF
jgi:hypothetical protein